MASAPKTTRQWLLASPPTDLPIISGPKESQTFRLATTDIPTLKPDQVLLHILYWSNDPAQRGWISKDIKPNRLYRKPVEVNDVMSAGTICEVIESTASAIKVGAKVQSYAGWTEYAVVDAKAVVPLPDLPDGLPITHYLGAFGGTGLTAYYGFNVVSEAKPEDVVVVSGAAGATGSMVVQIAKKMVGCQRVIGIAGGAKKCKWVVESLGADACVDYKSQTFAEDLIKETGGDNADVSVYFDNVGGDILDLMFTRLARNGRIAACGAISSYNTSLDRLAGLKNWFEVISMRLQIKGFIVTDLITAGRRNEALDYLRKGLAEGKLKIGEENQEVVPTKFEDVPKVWMTLFEGANTGKLVTKLEDANPSSRM